MIHIYYRIFIHSYHFFFLNLQELISNELKRRKRRARAREEDTEDHHVGPDDAERKPLPSPKRRPKRVKIYEHYESKRTKVNKIN